MLKRALCFLLLCCLVSTAALADAIRLESIEMLSEVTDVTEEGFLPEGADPVYFKDHPGGHWLWISSTERIEITRYTQEKPKLMYYIADIRLAKDSGLAISSVSKERPGRYESAPANLAQTDRMVYAQNADYYTYRVKNNQYPGHIVRNGQILYSKSLSKYFVRLPNLATLALYADGRAEVSEAHEKTAAEYVESGARDVVAFGPILIRDGEIQDINTGTFCNKEPRSCLGWIEQGHFVGLLVEGRRNHSVGANMLTCAELLKEQGCVGAINLDGGGSAAMLFMGESVQMTDRGAVADTIRWMPDLIYAGTY